MMKRPRLNYVMESYREKCFRALKIWLKEDGKRSFTEILKEIEGNC